MRFRNAAPISTVVPFLKLDCSFVEHELLGYGQHLHHAGAVAQLADG
jgi:hypothetical protein